MNTTRFLLIGIAFLLLPAANVLAQSVDSPRFGLKLGLNGTNLYDDAMAENRDGRIGFTGGGFVKIPLAKSGKLALRPELLFTLKGSEFELNGFKSDYRLSYIELPVSFEYRLLGFINLHGGMWAGILANANGETDDIVGTIKYATEDFQRLDYGYHFGGGLDIGNIGLHLRISRGLEEINDAKAYFGSLKNSAWTLSFSTAF